MKVVINRKYGGFGLSQEAYQELIKRGIPYFENYKDSTTDGPVIYGNNELKYRDGPLWDIWFRSNRTNPDLIAVIEELGPRANGKSAKLLIVEIPDDIEWVIEDFSGMEHVAEKGRTWPQDKLFVELGCGEL